MGRRSGTIGVQQWLLVLGLVLLAPSGCSSYRLELDGQSWVGSPSMVSIAHAITLLGALWCEVVAADLIFCECLSFVVHCSKVAAQN